MYANDLLSFKSYLYTPNVVIFYLAYISYYCGLLSDYKSVLSYYLPPQLIANFDSGSSYTLRDPAFIQPHFFGKIYISQKNKQISR